MQDELSRYQVSGDSRLRLEVPVYAPDLCERLLARVAYEDILCEHAVDMSGSGKPFEPFYRPAVRDEAPAAAAPYRDVRVEVGHVLLDDCVESVADRQDEYQCSRAYGHADRADCGNYIDDIVRFPGKQVSCGYEKSRVQPSSPIFSEAPRCARHSPGTNRGRSRARVLS